MAVVTVSALLAILKGKRDDEMIHVRIADPTGYRYAGKIGSIMDTPGKPTVDVLAEDGELVCNVPVSRVLAVDVRPRVDYPLMTTGEFVQAVVGSGTSNFTDADD